MIRRYLPAILSLSLCLLAPALAAQEEGSVYVYRSIYKMASTLPQKYAAVLSMSTADDSGAAPVMAEALGDLLAAQANYKSPGDQELHARAVALALSSLGSWKYADASALAWQAFQQMRDPSAKAEALMAIGSMRDSSYAERIALFLAALNPGPGADPAGEETEAYAAVAALRKLRDPVGYAPVFFAGDAWYSRRVKDLALSALPDIASDPTDALVEIIRVESLDRKVKALDLALASKASADRKLVVVRRALDSADQFVAQDMAQINELKDLRTTALRGFIALKGTGDDLVPLFAKFYRQEREAEDKVIALQALGVDGSEAAAAALRDIIVELNEQQRSGLVSDDRDTVMKAAIQYAALTGKKSVGIALEAVRLNDRWGSSMVLLASEAERRLK